MMCFITIGFGVIVILLYIMNERIDNIDEILKNVQTKIDDIGLKTNYIEPQHKDIYTKLNLLSSMLNDIRDSNNSFHTNNHEPKSEK